MATVDHVMVPGKLGSPENFALCGSNLFKVIKFHLLTAWKSKDLFPECVRDAILKTWRPPQALSAILS